MNNRLTRRTLQIQPPLRGRLATTVSEKQKKYYSVPVIRDRPRKPTNPKHKTSVTPKSVVVFDKPVQQDTISQETTVVEQNTLINQPTVRQDSKYKYLFWLILLLLILLFFFS